MKRILLAMAVLCLPSAPIMAAEFNVAQADKSAVSFVSKQMGVPVEGRFKKFVTQVSFDPVKPETAKAQIEIELSSIDAGSNDANEEVKSKAWFNIREFPLAKFASTGIKALGNGRYEASGKMTIKGKTRDVTAPFNAKPDGPNLVIDGTIPVLRLQYGLGDGIWSDTGTVADEVQVRFHFTLASSAAPKK